MPMPTLTQRHEAGLYPSPSPLSLGETLGVTLGASVSPSVKWVQAGLWWPPLLVVERRGERWRSAEVQEACAHCLQEHWVRSLEAGACARGWPLRVGGGTGRFPTSD